MTFVLRVRHQLEQDVQLVAGLFPVLGADGLIGVAAVLHVDALKFLREGNRVKVTVRFRGREMAHTNIGEGLLRSFADGCSEVANMEKNPKLDGRHMSIFLSPKKEK